MKTILFLSLLACAPAWAGSTKVTTVVAKTISITNAAGGVTRSAGAASFALPAGEAAKILTILANAEEPYVVIVKDGLVFVPAVAVGTVIQGPATITVTYRDPTLQHEEDGALLTIERWRVPKVTPSIR